MIGTVADRERLREEIHDGARLAGTRCALRKRNVRV